MEKCYIISGRVQGVGFRYWLVHQVKAIGEISGYVCNLSSGDVGVYAKGDALKIQELLVLLYKGPLWARVDNVVEAVECKQFFPPIENGVFKRL